MTASVSSSASASGRGFTLLEVLVVLVITSLISVVLIQGLGTVLNLRNSFGAQMLDLDKVILKRNLVRLPLSGLVGDFNDGANIFAGNETLISGLTLQTLSRRPGRPTPFTLAIEFNEEEKLNALVYRESNDKPMTLVQWTGERARFKFIGDPNGWLKSWPPDSMAANSSNMIGEIRPPQLPELIYIETNSVQEPDFAVEVLGRRNRIPRDPIFDGKA